MAVLSVVAGLLVAAGTCLSPAAELAIIDSVTNDDVDDDDVDNGEYWGDSAASSGFKLISLLHRAGNHRKMVDRMVTSLMRRVTSPRWRDVITNLVRMVVGRKRQNIFCQSCSRAA